jgi:phospholipase C
MGYPQALEHLIVVSLENRSFDQLLGALGSDAAWLATHPGERINGVGAGYENVDQAGAIHRTNPFPSPHARKHVWTPDAPHGADMVRLQIITPQPNNPGSEMGGFVQAFERRHPGVANPGDIMLHYTRGDVPIAYHFADHFAVCDNWFAAVAGDTFPNRMYAIAGDCGGIETTDFNFRFLHEGKLTTVFEEMSRFGDSWAMYSGVLPMGLALPRVRRLCKYTHGAPAGRSRWLSQFAIDVANDKLPKLSWLEPTYYWHANGLPGHLPCDPTFGEPNCDHPPSDIARGQQLLRWIYDVLRTHSEVWRKAALVVTYDEHGGFFDHVPPPQIHDEVERNRRLDGGFTDRFTRRGPRVPAFIAAPWVRSRVIHDRFDHCSILKFVCEWCGIPPWTERIASPRISSLDVAFEATVQVTVPPPPPEAPPAAAQPADGPPPVEPDLGAWLPRIHAVMKKPTEDRQPLVLDAEVFSIVAAGTGVHTVHIATPDVDGRAATVMAEGAVIESDSVVDGQRVVALRKPDQTRVVIWAAQP